MVIPIYRFVAFLAAGEVDLIMQNWINYLSVAILAVSLFWLLLSNTRKSMVIAYVVMVVVVFSINIQFWTFGFALSKMITAIMALLVVILNSTPGEQYDLISTRAGRIFKAAGLVFFILLITFTIKSTSEFLSLSVDQTLPALFVLLCGFLLLGTSQDPFRVIVGLMIILVGFEIIYGAVEQSLLINGLLAAVFMFIAVIGSYLTTPREQKDQE